MTVNEPIEPALEKSLTWLLTMRYPRDLARERLRKVGIDPALARRYSIRPDKTWERVHRSRSGWFVLDPRNPIGWKVTKEQARVPQQTWLGVFAAVRSVDREEGTIQ